VAYVVEVVVQRHEAGDEGDRGEVGRDGQDHQQDAEVVPLGLHEEQLHEGRRNAGTTRLGRTYTGHEWAQYLCDAVQRTAGKSQTASMINK
jgi:hypothetical protein